MPEAGVSYNAILQAKECKIQLKSHLCLIRARIQTAPPGKHHSSCWSGRSCSPVAKRVEHFIIRAGQDAHSPLCSSQAVCHGQTSQSTITHPKVPSPENRVKAEWNHILLICN